MLLLALLVLSAAIFLRQHFGNITPPPLNDSATPAPVASVAPPPEPVSISIPAAPVVANAPTDEQRQAAIDAETDRLQQWSTDDDPTSLSNILADLTSSEKEIRDAAVEAAKQFGSTNAIPALKAAAESTDDVQQKIAYLEAADFLALPSMDLTAPSANPPTPEQIQMAQQQGNVHQPNHQMHGHGPNQNAPPGSDQNPQPGPPNN